MREPLPTVRFVTVSCDAWLRVPMTTTEAKDCAVARLTDAAAPVNVTADDVAVKPPADEVSQDPLRVNVAEAKEIVAPAEEIRLPFRTTVDEVSVTVPAKVRVLANVVETPGPTVTLFTVCGTLIVPPEAFTTIVDDPTANEPALVSMDRTVIVDPLATRLPPAAMVSADAATEKLAVDSVVVPGLPCTVKLFATRRPFAARVNVTGLGPANATL